VESDYARQKFANQKSISSDQYFGRHQHDESGGSDRIRQFEGATSISSNQYFGREEEDTSGGDIDLNNLEGTARDFARRFAEQATSDYEVIKGAVERGGEKLREYIDSLQVCAFDLRAFNVAQRNAFLPSWSSMSSLTDYA
jgi:ADP-ribosylation factor GTPase-activating protein 2/3